MIIGYRIVAHDNDSFAYCDRDDVKRCHTCGNMLDKWSEKLDTFQIKKRRNIAVTTTYDGVLVATSRFIEFCRDYAFDGLIAKQLPSDPDFYAISSDVVVKYDTERRGTRFLGYCSTCGMYDEVIGADPVMLRVGELIPDRGFAQTDIEFASHDEKHPLLLCGLSVGELLGKSGMRGLDLRSIKSVSK